MIDLEIRDRVATLSLNSPPANTITPQWSLSFHDALEQIEQTAHLNVLHLRSSSRLFCAGADLKVISAGFAQDSGLIEFTQALQSYQRLLLRIENLPCVTFCEINGAALGGGLELALACDLRAVANDAKVGLPEVSLGLLPAIGGTQRLSALCGASLARRMIFLAEVLSGEDAVKYGLANWAFPATELADRSGDLVQRLAGMPTLSLRAAKACIRAFAAGANGFEMEISESTRLFVSEETQSAVAKFLDGKRGDVRRGHGRQR